MDNKELEEAIEFINLRLQILEIKVGVVTKTQTTIIKKDDTSE